MPRFLDAGGLDFYRNIVLESLPPMQLEFTRDVHLFNNFKLASIPAIENAAKFDGDLWVIGCLELPALALHATHVAGDLEIDDNLALAALSADVLADARSVTVIDNPLIPVAAFPALRSMQSLRILFNQALGQLAMPLVTQAMALRVEDNAKLPTCEVLALFAGITAPSKAQSGNDTSASCAP